MHSTVCFNYIKAIICITLVHNLKLDIVEKSSPYKTAHNLTDEKIEDTERHLTNQYTTHFENIIYN